MRAVFGLLALLLAALILSPSKDAWAGGVGAPGVPSPIGNKRPAINYPPVGAVIPPTGCAADPYHATDGCDGSNPNSNFLKTNFATYAAESGQTLAHWPAWWLAGASDSGAGVGGYPVGYYTSKGSLLDAANQTNLPVGCTYWLTGHGWYSGFGPMVDCASVASPTIAHLDFDKLFCVQLSFEPSVTASPGNPVRITDSNFEGDATCAGAGASVGFVPPFIGLVYFVGGATANVNVSFSSFEGHWTDSCCDAIYNSTDQRGVGLAGIFYLGNGGTQGLVTVSYSDFVGFNGTTIGLETANPAGNPGGIIIEHSYMEGVEHRAPYGHTDGIFYQASQNPLYYNQHFDAHYNVVLQPGDAVASGTSWFFNNTGGASGHTASQEIDHNTMLVGNYVTGATTVTNTVSGTISNGSGGAGNIFHLTAGSAYTGECDSTASFCLGVNIDPTHWYIDCTLQSTSLCGSNVAKFYPTVSVGPLTITNRVMFNTWAFVPGVEHSHGTITTPSLHDNYIDSFIADGFNPFRFAATCTNPVSYSGNINMRTGATITPTITGTGC